MAAQPLQSDVLMNATFYGGQPGLKGQITCSKVENQ